MTCEPLPHCCLQSEVAVLYACINGTAVSTLAPDRPGVCNRPISRAVGPPAPVLNRRADSLDPGPTRTGTVPALPWKPLTASRRWSPPAREGLAARLL